MVYDMYVCICVCICVCVYVCMYVCMYVCFSLSGTTSWVGSHVTRVVLCHLDDVL